MSYPFQNNLLAQVQVGNRKGNGPALWGDPHGTADIVAGGIRIVIKPLQNTFLGGEGADILFHTPGQFRRGEQRLPCKRHDMSFAFSSLVPMEEPFGGGKGHMVHKGQFQEGQDPEKGRTVYGDDIQGREQVIEGVIFRFPLPADQQASTISFCSGKVFV